MNMQVLSFVALDEAMVLRCDSFKRTRIRRKIKKKIALHQNYKYSSKYTRKNLNKKNTEWEKVFEDNFSNKCVISRLYKEPLQFKTKKTNDSIQNEHEAL